MEQILGSTLVCDPIRLLEICAPNDGAAAVVVASEKKMRQLGAKGIRIAGISHSISRYSSDFRCPAESMSATVDNAGPTEVTAQRVYEAAGIGVEDVDCFEVQDTDAFCEIELYEELGLCGVGEGGRLIDSGEVEIGGKTPVNMSGGLISKGEPIGASHLGQVVELVEQLRGNCGPRQVEGAKVALGHVLGAGGNCAITILSR